VILSCNDGAARDAPAGEGVGGPDSGVGPDGYFAYHLVEGGRGLKAWLRVTQDLRQAKENLAAVSVERQALEHKVAHMRPDHLDPDLLGFAGPQDARSRRPR